MKLKGIKIFGFKSFADKTEIDFKSNITAVVGPNGSGKSNIVDAIRWVLGEQSVKSLRGGKEMTDVIFAGSETRSPLKRAEVELLFDNSEKFLNTDLVDVAVKRVLYQTGESEYFINNAKVRLKDVTNLFLDSGIGGDTLNIISQGSVESIVNSKPVDRRIILEGAARVLKYKTRKQESIKKLEKTNDNLEKIQLVIDELNVSLEPLKKQSEDARRYLEIDNELKDIEIALTTNDITNYNLEYESIREQLKKLEEEKLELETSGNKENNEVESLKVKSLEIENKIENLNNEYNELVKKLSNAEKEKTLLLERQKYQVDSEKLDTEYLKLKEDELKATKELERIKFSLEKDKKDYQDLKEKEEKNKLEYTLLIKEKNRNREYYENLVRKEVSLQNQIEVLNNNINEDVFMPSSVKAVLHNPRLKGIHGTIGKLIDTPDKYASSISVCLGGNANFVVTSDEEMAHEAIKYLKENHLGRVTFFPLNIIKGKYVEEETLKIVSKFPGYIGLANSLVNYKEEYKNIVSNLLGNVLVTKDISSMQSIAKAINYKYRVVSLDGEIVHSGGSLTGGNLSKKSSSILEKRELERVNKELSSVLNNKNEVTNKIKELQSKISDYEKAKDESVTKIYNLELWITDKEKKVLDLEEELNNLQSSLKRNASYKSDNVLESISNLMTEEKNIAILKDKCEQDIIVLKKERSDIESKIKEQEFTYRKKNSELHTVETNLNDLKIKKEKIDVKMDYLLNLLSETYHLTYEKAKEEYVLDEDINLARERVMKLKREKERFGNVNLGSIEEYDRIKTRYDFLFEQKKDLNLSIEELNNIITEMDTLMVEKLQTAFLSIEKEFEEVFTKLFKGGKGMLKLTDPDNILETGIEIIAEPPGKKLNNIGLLSGGEKTLTAIALLFSILNVFPVPFCILDEVEAALDEANVDTFGVFLQELKEKCEYILITHKKRTMEYADTLYGITMQEQGVSKIVSVKLENKE